jgi:hypothetical protein
MEQSPNTMPDEPADCGAGVRSVSPMTNAVTSSAQVPHPQKVFITP